MLSLFYGILVGFLVDFLLLFVNPGLDSVSARRFKDKSSDSVADKSSESVASSFSRT